MYAASHGQVETVQLLLQNRANPNAQSEDDKTALMHSLSLLAQPEWEPIWLQVCSLASCANACAQRLMRLLWSMVR